MPCDGHVWTYNQQPSVSRSQPLCGLHFQLIVLKIFQPRFFLYKKNTKHYPSLQPHVVILFNAKTHKKKNIEAL